MGSLLLGAALLGAGILFGVILTIALIGLGLDNNSSHDDLDL